MISIIYIYYNSAQVIFNSIDSVLSSESENNIEIIVVVNKCTDIQISELESYSDKIKVIENNGNIGFGAANNIGVKKASGELILILNPDTILKNNVISYLSKKMGEDSSIGISTCKLLNENNLIQKTVIYKKFNLTYLMLEFYFVNKIPILRDIFKGYFYCPEEYEHQQYPEVVSGAFILIRKDLFNKINGFDEDFFMYSEDHNLCLRAKKIQKIVYFPEVEVIHLGAHSLGSEPSEFKLDLMLDSLLLNVKKMFHPIKVFLFKFVLVVNALIMLLLSYIIKSSIHKNLLSLRSKIILRKLLYSQNAKNK